MGEIVSFMFAPFIVTLAIVAIHVYLGIHIIEREVIFVDLALAQIAALGTTVAFIFGIHPEESLSYLFSLGFVIFGSVLFALTRVRNQRIPQEAIIGITYVMATAASILVADQAAGGAEHIKEILMGAILWVNWGTILPLVILYATVGVIHYLFRERFIRLTNKYREGNFQKGDRLWDFFFYLTFGLVIVFSVRVAGILLVFSFLVVPTAISALYSLSWKVRLLIGWAVGLIVTVLGLFLSYVLDLPAGPSIVLLLGIFLVLMASMRKVIFRRE